MNPDDSSPLFDSHGNPVRKPQSDREALEALIRSELAEAKERLHELNKEGLKDIADRYYKPKISFWHKTNAYTFAALVAVLLFGWFAIPEIIRTKTISYFRDNLVGPALTNTVNNIVNRPKYADVVLSVFKASSIAADGWLFIKDYENDSLGIYVFPKPAPLDE